MKKPKRQPVRKAASAPRHGVVAKILSDQPALLATALGTLAIGVLARRGDLVKGGTRMLATGLLASAGRAALVRHADAPKPAPTNPHLTDAVVGGMIGWAAEAVVTAVFERLEGRAASPSPPPR